MRLLRIEGMSTDHAVLREELCDAIPSMSLTDYWVKVNFSGSWRKFRKVLDTWRNVRTCGSEILHVAMALFLRELPHFFPK